MPRIRFVHAADLHLDTPFEGIAAPAPRVAEALRDASLQAWDELVRLTLRRGASALFLAGDLYDGAQRGLRAQLRVMRGLAELSQAGVRVFIVHGNHDPLDGWSAIREWPPGVHVFGDREVETLPLDREGETVAFVHGISYARRDVRENLARRFRRSAATGPQIGLLHASVGTSSEHAAYAPCALSDLQSSGLDYWALGHIHRREVLRAGHPWVVYPGNLQGRSPKPSETGAKGAYVVELDTAANTFSSPEFVALDKVRFVALPHDIEGSADLPGLLCRLDADLRSAHDEHEGRGLLARVVLEGRGDVAADLRRAGTLEHVTADLRERLETLAPFVWVESVVNHTAGLIDPAAIRERDEFSAAVLARAEQLAADEEQLAAFVAERCSQLSAGQVGTETRLSSNEAPQETLAEALALVLDRLERAEDE